MRISRRSSPVSAVCQERCARLAVAQDQLRYQVLKLPGLRRVRPEPGRRHPRAALHPTRLSPAEVEALIADYEGGAAL